MSSLLILQDRNNIIMASDTASSIVENNVAYRVSDNESKIFNIGKYKMFASGQKHIRDLFISIIESDIEGFTPNKAEKILKETFSMFDEFSLEVVIGENFKGGTRITILSSYEKFNSRESFSNTDEISLFAAGIKTNEISQSFEDNFIKSEDILTSIIKAYEDNQSEEVGGSVEIHQLSTNKVKKIKLSDVQLNRMSAPSPVSLIIGDRIIGRLIMGSSLIIEDENGIIKIDGSTQTIFDPLGNEKVVLGKYDTDKYGLAIKGGAVDIRTSATSNQGVVLDSEGFRSYKSNGTESFRLDNSGNAIFSGNLSAAGGTFSGNLNAAGGSFSGSLNAASGSFSGDITGSNGTFNGSLSGATITGGSITGATITGGSITSNTNINVTTNATVGNNLYMTGSGVPSAKRGIVFDDRPNNGASIESDGGEITMTGLAISVGTLGHINVFSGLGTRFTNDVDFTNATVIWGTNRPTAVWG